MTHKVNAFRGGFLRFRRNLRGDGAPQEFSADSAPFRSELFSAGQMEQHGKTLAGSHELSGALANDRLLVRLAENQYLLIRARGVLTDAVRAEHRITPAGEWLLDNFYLIEEQVRAARRHLPKGYSRELPRLRNGPSAGLPRVYDIALETIAHGDGRVDPEALIRFVAAYQTVTSLNLGELWAIPIMLRLALIENLRRIAARLAANRLDRNLAASWADQMTEVATKDPKGLILAIADMARSNPPMTTSFVAELARRLQGQSAALALPLTWIEQRLSEDGLTIEQLVQAEAQQQAGGQVSISNTIGSLRSLSATDWREFVESMSAVEQVLREDPCGTYVKMDFSTRDRYRHVVERLARKSPQSESEVARKAIRLAREFNPGPDGDRRAAHVGFYLIDKGLPRLEQLAGVRRSTSGELRRLAGRFPLLTYLSPIFLLTVTLTAGAIVAARGNGLGPIALFWVGILSAVCASQLAIALANWAVTLRARPDRLPRMDFARGIPAESRTLVVIPTMLVSGQNLRKLLEDLEVRFLANQDEHLHFALLTDFRDAGAETTPEDEPLLLSARTGIEELNQKYAGAESDRFFLFHRPRRWNQRERIWMGYERKRGKLSELNSLLRGSSKGHFALVVGATEVLSSVKYVLTLDTDTQLPRDSAWQCVAAMAHPLNRPRYSEAKQRVVEGYGILQPRVSVSLPPNGLSRYARLFGSEPGIDPYTRAISDVYQDLFAEGSFIGKGIYDVDAFERALDGRFPENRILSHDLLEGCYARAGLLSDVQLYEEYPSRYSSDVSRVHRWIRGDWQIARWCLPGAPGLEGRSRRNPLSALSRWKIFDNLRRSLAPPCLTILLALAWSALRPAWLWTLSVVGVILIPPVITAISEFLRKPEDTPVSQHFTSTAHSLVRRMYQTVFILACLPHQAFVSLDAIGRTLGRTWFTRRRLLEWNTSADANANSRAELSSSVRLMWLGPLLAAAIAIDLAVSRPEALGLAAPILCLWFASPVIAWRISRSPVRTEASLTARQIIFLRKLSRKTWAFFETFVVVEDNWLPPDNYQEQPVAIVAHRTSPTNIGLSLLANLSAYDFGYISAGRLIERTHNTFLAMERLERSRGHFYNWYDTRSLRPLAPIFISTVDSGNLAGHLLTLRPGLLAIADEAIVGRRFFDGLEDTSRILLDLAGATIPAPLIRFQSLLSEAQSSPPATLTAARMRIEELELSARESAAGFAASDQTAWWASALARQCLDALNELIHLTPASSPVGDPIPTLRELAGDETDLVANGHARERIAAIETLAQESSDLARMDYDFLFDRVRHLLSLGYHVGERRLDPGCYDLLASEARLCSFVAIAQGQLPQENWFALGRQLISSDGGPTLLSWSGSMFEYLMPMLVMPTYENTLLDQTCKAAVERQIRYGASRGAPWGISESGYNTLDANFNYQYRAFGVPGLGLKRGLAEDLVIAPYASALALMVAPEAACLNLERLAAEGFEGRYGFYEAIDYTPSRLPRGKTNAVIRSFMAHHQGMSLLSLAYLLLDRPMQRRFESDPSFQATALLLQERALRSTRFRLHTAELSDLQRSTDGAEAPVRVLNRADTPAPEVQLLSNGRYHVMVTNAGGGYSRWKDLAITRWREDFTRDNWGSFCYIRDVRSGEFWSTAFQPTLKRPDKYEVIFSEGRAAFRRSDHGFDTHTEIAVSPEDDIELRRVSVTNSSGTRKTIEITSYAEIVLNSAAADALHPAFSNLFVQTEVVAQKHAILCNRRPRSVGEPSPWMFHLVAIRGTENESVSYETDRMRFIGRGNTAAKPQALAGLDILSGSQGSVLDPIVAVRFRITLDPGQSATLDMVIGVAESRDGCLALIDKYQDRRLADRVFDLAWTHTQVVLRQINVSDAEAQLYARMAGSVIYTNSSLRADPAIIRKNNRGQSGLWGYSISGDLPIVLLQIADAANLELVRQLVQAHAYWRLKGLAVDLMIWNESHAGYRQVLHDQIMGLIAAGVEANVADRPGGIFVRSLEQISNEDRILLQSVARLIFTDVGGTLREQIDRVRPALAAMPRLASTKPGRAEAPVKANTDRQDLIFFNGLGGFTPDGREYVISTSPSQVTPAPWVNVLANDHFGTVISESGGAYTWSENAHEYRLTPWHNDPVSDSSGEAFYIRDEETGHFWSPAPLPRRGVTPYLTRHGFGYSVFEHTEGGIHSETWVYVALDAAVKFTVLKLRNVSGRSRRLSATGYVEWVLGDLRPKSLMHVTTGIEPVSGALVASNPYNTEFAARVAFFDANDSNRSVSGDRTEFIGRNGTLSAPAAMARSRLSGRVGSALDPCAAIQIPFELPAGQEREIIFTLGAGRDVDDASNLARRFRGSGAAKDALAAVWQYWKHTLGAVHVETPDPSINMLTNGWLIYQTLACRLWARSGYYQSGGAFGFRDQLQDTMALIHAEPGLVRQHLLLCASRQFVEGDVQHWWHPPGGRGVRTHCSDDYLWLPFVASHYVETTGDTGVLDERINFIEARAVNADEDSFYGSANASVDQATLYQHCVKAILNGLHFGVHGLPLMGSGDWNDGMNLVGNAGKGESVWLGFFLCDTLRRFRNLALARGDASFAEECRNQADQLQDDIEQHGWDGNWYLRAYFDDGSPLGSECNPECQIDSIPQSWSVLSGAGGADRARMGMDAVDRRLVRRDDSLIRLLDPPFDKSSLDPGYIKGYVPGVRENGGQYTHAAIWAVMAFAKLGDDRRAWELFAMINPTSHGSSAEAIATYKVEPYVVAADVYALWPHTGRGGWTWYTGSAGWMYRLILESLLGLRLEGNRLRFTPCIPADWKDFKIHYRYRETIYHITVLQVDAAETTRLTLDQIEQHENSISLVDDRQEHSAELRIHRFTRVGNEEILVPLKPESEIGV